VSTLVWLATSALVGVAAMRVIARRPARSRWRRVMRGIGSIARPDGGGSGGGSGVRSQAGATGVGHGVWLGFPWLGWPWSGWPWSGWPWSGWRRRAVVGLVALGAGTVAAVAAGPVACAVTATYAALAVRLWARSTTGRAQARSYRAAVESVAALAADLRAGQPVGPALAAAEAIRGPVVGEPAGAVVGRVAAAVALAEASGAPLAEVLDRLDTHLRGVDRARATASAQAAGARASALLLAAMPVAGVGLGAVVGVDSASVLLHTPLGSACLATAVILQLAGLAWAGRLSRVEVPA
jgi:tight adherence protein B